MEKSRTKRQKKRAGGNFNCEKVPRPKKFYAEKEGSKIKPIALYDRIVFDFHIIQGISVANRRAGSSKLTKLISQLKINHQKHPTN